MVLLLWGADATGYGLGMGLEFKDKVILHCFREVKCQQGFTAGV